MREVLSFNELRAPLKSFQALQEASRCLYCFDAPCRKGCPADIDVPGFIKALKTGNLKRAARLIFDANILGNSCGRVCPTELLCEKGCSTKLINSPIAIGALQSYIMDHAPVDIPGEIPPAPFNKGRSEAGGIQKKVAVIGSGPAGLACAAELARLGYPVDVYESREKTGGMLRYGVPKYRLPERVIEEEVSRVKARGVNFIVSSPVAEDLNKLLKSEYCAVFVSSGLSKSQHLNIPPVFALDSYTS
ncbi:MAG: NAD(P)-binding protein, partial [Firmicutes bacterium]|nr:NAD(P)-binding protein [Bacillota bacterium]